MGSQKAVNAQNDSFEEFFRSLLKPGATNPTSRN
jgi:hypothetical protein